MIGLAEKEDALAIARFHLENVVLPYGRTEERIEVLELWYRVVASNEDTFCFVHSSANNDINGFAVTVVGRFRLLLRLIRENSSRLLVDGLQLVMRSPRDALLMTKDLLCSLYGLVWDRMRFASSDGAWQKEELTPIVVAKVFQGSGIAGLLLSAAERALRRRKETGYCLSVPKDNMRALHF